MKPNMRLFIAINFNNNTKSRLLTLRDELEQKSEKGKFSLPENLHLTLVFLGECDFKKAAVIKAVMDSINIIPFEITIDQMGCFKRDNGDIWWAGIQENKPLLDLQNQLTDKLIMSEFMLEKRKYSPHITLGREIITNAQSQSIESFSENVSAFQLMKSERINGKLTYTAIYEKELNCFHN